MTRKSDHDEIIQAMELCLRAGLHMASLVLAYALIDALAWLLYGDPPGGCRERFTKWVNRFLLPVLPSDCTALDLYGARCAVLHTLTSEAHLISTGDARPLTYNTGIGSDEMRCVMEALFPGVEAVHLDIAALVPALRTAAEQFDLYLRANSSSLPEVAQRRNKKYVFLAQDELAELAEGVKRIRTPQRGPLLERDQDQSQSGDG